MTIDLLLMVMLITGSVLLFCVSRRMGLVATGLGLATLVVTCLLDGAPIRAWLLGLFAGLWLIFLTDITKPVAPRPPAPGASASDSSADSTPS